MKRSLVLLALAVLAGAIVPSMADAERVCDKWGYEGITLNMPVRTAARVAEGPLSRYSDRKGRGGSRSYPWSVRGEDSIRIILDHSLPGDPVVGILAITRAEKRLPEFLWWWPSPSETYETDHVRQYVWHDTKCNVRATLTMVFANDKILISILKPKQRADGAVLVPPNSPGPTLAPSGPWPYPSNGRHR